MQIPIYSPEEFEKELNLLKEDVIYDFEVTESEDKVSQAGNEMTVVSLTPNVPNLKFPIKEYFVFTNKAENRRGHYASIKKIENFLLSINLPYTANALTKTLHQRGKFTLEHRLDEKNGKKYWGVKGFVISKTDNAPFVPSQTTSISANSANPPSTTSQKPGNSGVDMDNDDIPF